MTRSGFAQNTGTQMAGKQLGAGRSMPRVLKRLKMLTDFVLSYVIENYQYDYWHFPHKHSPLIDQGDYFINFIPKTNFPGPFDADGIPLLDMSTQHSAQRNGDIVYSPIVISQYALGWYSRYLRDNDPSALANFLNVAHWMLGQAQCFEKNGDTVTVLPIDHWFDETLSGLAQGLAISMWCRAFQATQKPEYLTMALNAFNAFKLPVEEGGVVDTSLGFPVLEEWSKYRAHILNGHLFAFAGIIDLLGAKLEQNKKEEIASYYEQYLASSLKLIAKSNMLFWTRYSLRPMLIPNIASYFYHDLHIEMLQGLYKLTGVAEFRLYAERWKRQQQRLLFRLGAMLLKLANRVEIEFRGLKLE